MYGARLTRDEWLGPLALNAPTRPATAPCAGPGGGTPSWSGPSLGVNVTPCSPRTSAAVRAEGGRARPRLQRAETPPALAGPDQDHTRTEALQVARGVLAALAIAAVLGGVALAMFWPLANGRPDGVHLVAPFLVAAGGALLVRLRAVTRSR